ncbi:MAG: LLM class F420-dependent oxidoreductase [Actinobacteria bacterium]|nr:LLM class F420-dependent oxidoreductase [Actinomycetota bacterium]
MKFGIIFANIGPAVQPDYAARLGQLAEENGIESVWTVEHVVVPAGYESQYPYSPTGRMPGPEESPIPDPLIWLTYMAAVTTNLKLGTGVLILPQRNPVVLAKELATLDVLSKGRTILGIGVGWLEEEFNAIGIPFSERAARTDETVAALRELWTAEEPTFNGQFTSFEKAKMYPKPPQGQIPIVVGGHTKAAARRAGRLGDGFFPASTTPESLAELLEVMHKSAADAGRNGDAIEISAGGAMDVDGIKKFADLGVSRIVIPPLGFDEETLKAQLGQFNDNVISKLS